MVLVSELVTNAVVHAGTDVELLCRLEPVEAGAYALDEHAYQPDGYVPYFAEAAETTETAQSGEYAPASVEAGGSLVIEVSDHHPARAVRGDGLAVAQGTPEFGRGLHLVSALSTSWGVTYRPGTKTVWARLPIAGLPAVLESEAYAGESAPQRGFSAAGPPFAPPGRGSGDQDWVNHGALSFLAEASDLLAGQLDEDLVAALAGQLLVPRLADWCAVWLNDEDGRAGWGTDAATGGRRATERHGGAGAGAGTGASGWPRLARVWHVNENRIEELRRILEKEPPMLPDTLRSGAVPVPWPGAEAPHGPSGGASHGAADGASGHTPDHTSDVRSPDDRPPDDMSLDGRSSDDTSEAPGAALAYQLIAGGRPLGTLVIGRSGLTRFPDEITGLVEDFCRRVALAIGAARQYARQATISRVLQRGLLPTAVAQIPGVESALVYEPRDKGGPGGDFYDVFPAGHGRWCFALGDVQGKGPEAAVVIGLARPWLRLLAREGYQVAEVLDRLNQMLLDDATEAADAAARAIAAVGGPDVPPEGSMPRFLSLLYGELVPTGDGVHCTLASAGHPLPLLLRPDGDVRAAAAPQVLLGVVEDVTYHSESLELRAGDTLLCVTDGVTERRSGRRQFDDGDGLAVALADCAGLSAPLVAERIRRLVHEFADGPPEDDLALLVLQAQ
ncbi:ATP-binding SpoIIE family protein phosphatase [Streptomyces jeddahensis]|nr:ATP-binding SpoIIE family protein phosphatase [Streptomyces jeddahensis]